MRILLMSMIASVFFLISACEDKTPDNLTSDVNLNFKAFYDNQLMLLEKEYLYAGDMPIKFSQFNFYIAEVVLIKQNGSTVEETELFEIDFLDFPHNLNQSDLAENGQVIAVKNIPAGRYDGIKIGFGVPEGLNATKPNSYNSQHPLSMASHYWDGWNSYIFSKLEGKADMDFDGIFETNDGEGLAYHTGTDEVYTVQTIHTSIEVKENETLELPFIIDLKKLFLMPNPAYDENSDGYLDIEDYESAHAADRLAISKQMMNNFADAFSIDH